MNLVATIGGVNYYPVGIGTVPVQIPDGTGATSLVVLNDVLYFPNSPVKIISVVHLGDDLNDSDGTWISTKRYNSVLKWDCEKFTKEIVHSTSRLPEILVNPGCTADIALCTALDTVCCMDNDPRTLDTVLPEDMFDASDEVIPTVFEAYAADARSDNGNKVSTDRTHDQLLSDEVVLSTDFFQIGDTVRYTKDDFSGIGTIININFGRTVHSPTYTIQINDSDHILETAKEFIFPLDIPDIAETAITENQVNDIIKCLTTDEMKSLLAKAPTNPLIDEFMSWHRRLGHLRFSAMFNLTEHGDLPQKFMQLKNKALLCPDCIIGSMKRRSWRSKGKPGVIRKPHTEVPGGEW